MLKDRSRQHSSMLDFKHMLVPADGSRARMPRCNVIFVESRGRRDLRRLAPGSVTGRVLASADGHVIVYPRG